MKYSASRGGHAPDHLREALETLIETGDGTAEVGGSQRPARWVVGQLWNCTDILPRVYCDEADLPPGSTYAQAARRIAAQS
jgi:hypothetical protein